MFFTSSFLFPAVLSLTLAQLTVDLRATPAEVTVWGGGDGLLGVDLELVDLNGDGALDLLFSERNYRGPSGQVGRVCAFFGPLALPSSYDLLIDLPTTCVVGSPPGPGALSVQGDTLVADLDQDGLVDLLVSSSDTFGGAVSVFRGRSTWPPLLDMQLDADWVFHGPESTDGLQTAAVGDLNGDAVLDLALFAPFADGPSNARENAGEGYIFFGPLSRLPLGEVHLATTRPDVVIYGADGKADNPPRLNVDGDRMGYRNSQRVSDCTGDGLDDLIVVSPYSAGFANSASLAGEAYVFFGRAVWPAQLDTRVPGDVDLTIYGPSANAPLESTAVADLDGDGVFDLLIGSSGDSPLGRTRAGSVFFFRGGAAMPPVIDLAVTPADGQWVGPRVNSAFGVSVAAGDFDGDGLVDIAGGGPDPTPLGRAPSAGAVYVVSGCEPLLGFHDLAVEAPALAIYGADSNDQYGNSLKLIDVDGDGMSDILAGAPGSRSRNNLRPTSTGEAHLVRGRSFTAPLCTVVPDAGPPATVCLGSDHLLNGSTTVVMGCSTAPVFRWLNGSAIVRGWAPDPTALVRPTATTTYRLEVRCGDCVGPCFASSSVLVTVEPEIIPPDLDNTLRTVRRGGDVDMLWGTVVDARRYSVFRGIVKDTWPAVPYIEGLIAAMVLLPDVTSPPNDSLYFYRASGASCSGVRGP